MHANPSPTQTVASSSSPPMPPSTSLQPKHSIEKEPLLEVENITMGIKLSRLHLIHIIEKEPVTTGLKEPK